MEAEQIGKIIRERRQFLKLTQQDLGEMAGITSRTIYEVENGGGNPSLQTLINILKVLGLELHAELKKLGT